MRIRIETDKRKYKQKKADALLAKKKGVRQYLTPFGTLVEGSEELGDGVGIQVQDIIAFQEKCV